MAYLVLVRHGQSQWNLENRFTGWVDVPLSPKGEEEAREAGRHVRGIRFDRAYTSALGRAARTLDLMLGELGQRGLPTAREAALNERMYGDLQGLDKDEMRKKFGEEQVRLWRRSYDVRPPNGESLEDTCRRTLPYFDSEILPQVKAGKNVLVAAHGNSLRSIVMRLDGLTPEQVVALEIPTGVPLVYSIDSAGRVVGKEIRDWKKG